MSVPVYFAGVRSFSKHSGKWYGLALVHHMQISNQSKYQLKGIVSTQTIEHYEPAQ
jgi:hypothetical protein